MKTSEHRSKTDARTFFLLGEVVDAVAEAEGVGERDPGAESGGAREGGGAVARGSEVAAAGERAVVAAAGAAVPVDAYPVAGVAVDGAQVAYRPGPAGVAGRVHALAQPEPGGSGGGHVGVMRREWNWIGGRRERWATEQGGPIHDSFESYSYSLLLPRSGITSSQKWNPMT